MYTHTHNKRDRGGGGGGGGRGGGKGKGSFVLLVSGKDLWPMGPVTRMSRWEAREVHNTQYTIHSKHTHTLSLSLSLSTSCPQIGAERASAPRHDMDFFDFITVSVYNQTGG